MTRKEFLFAIADEIARHFCLKKKDVYAHFGGIVDQIEAEERGYNE